MLIDKTALTSLVRTALVSRGHAVELHPKRKFWYGWMVVDGVDVPVHFSRTGISVTGYTANIQTKTFRYAKAREQTQGIDIGAVASHLESWVVAFKAHEKEKKEEARALKASTESISRLKKFFPGARDVLSPSESGIRLCAHVDEKTAFALLRVLQESNS